MSSKVINVNDEYRIFNNELNETVGPSFDNEKDAENFISWYDGNTSYIDTWLDERNWDQLLQEWSNYCLSHKKTSHHHPKKENNNNNGQRKKRLRPNESHKPNKRQQLFGKNNTDAPRINFKGIFKKIDVY